MRRMLVLLVGALLLVAGCGGGGSSDQPIQDRLAEAKTSLDHAKFIGFSLTSDDLPDGVTALHSAKGTGTHGPAFTGQVEVNRGLSFTAPLVAVNGKVYAKLPFVGWTTIDPDDYGAPDPAQLMSTSDGLSSLLTETRQAEDAGQEREGAAVLSKVSGELPGRDIQRLFPSAGVATYHAVFTLTDDNDLHSVVITGPFYGTDHGNVTYSIDLDLGADPVTIEPPE